MSLEAPVVSGHLGFRLDREGCGVDPRVRRPGINLADLEPQPH
jgi:hypothetical protein